MPNQIAKNRVKIPYITDSKVVTGFWGATKSAFIMNYYAYLPDKNGKEPLGTDNRIISENQYKSLKTFIRYRLEPYYKDNWTLWNIFSFYNFYDEKTFKKLR